MSVAEVELLWGVVDKIGELTEGLMVQCLEAHCKDFDFYSACDREPLKDFEQSYIWLLFQRDCLLW